VRLRPLSNLELFTTLLLLALPLYVVVRAAKRQLRLFVIVVEQGRITKVQGRMPQRLLDDIGDVIAREKPPMLRLVCRLEGGQAVLDFNETAEPGLRQVMRNLVGEYPALRLKQAPLVRRD
jgi:hypothetical protein